MKVKDKVELTERIKNFFKLNWWLVWISNILICVFIYSTSTSMSIQNEEIKNLLIKEVQGVVFLGANGQVVFGDKQKIDGTTESFKRAIKNTLIHYLINDGQKLTKDYTLKIDGYMDVVKNSDALTEFYNNFILKDDKKYPESVNLFKSILLGYARDIKQERIPEQIVPIDSTITNYIWNDLDQTFEIIINIKVNTYIYNNINNNYDLKAGTIQIRAKGRFDLFKNNNINPLGIQFFELGLTNASK